MLKVGITGGIGSGKTTACKLFEKLGVPVYYADQRAKELMIFDKQLKQQIIAAFGVDAYLENGDLNREYLAKVVFSNEQKLIELNDMVHPVVAADSVSWNEVLASKNFPYTIKEAALLVESGSYKHLDKLIVVTAPVNERVKRVMLRDEASEAQVLARVNAQLPDEEKLKLADFVIQNTDLIALANQVQEIHNTLLRLSGETKK